MINGILLMNLDEEQLLSLGVENATERQNLFALIVSLKTSTPKLNVKEYKEQQKQQKEANRTLPMGTHHSLSLSLSFSSSNVC